MIEIKCPKCQSTQCAPTFYTPYSIGCITCGHDFDLRGNFWQRMKAAFRGIRFGDFHH